MRTTVVSNTAGGREQRPVVEALVHLGPVNRAITRYVLRSVLPKRAYDKRQFAALISHTDFRTFDIQETPLSLVIELNK